MKWLGDLILKVSGWHAVQTESIGIKKGVLIGAPHTSNWDLVYTLAALHSMQIDVVFLAKKELFKPPLSWLLRFFGGVPVDRSKHTKLTEAMAAKIKERDEMIVLIPPEGSRGAVSDWKSGFYWTAHLAGVPILLGYLDYAKKEAGIGPAFYTTGDYPADLEKIKDFYRGVIPKFPEKFKL
jgi:1-acyl-sn-glycerol-3-phosphate acyltransferase